MPKDNAYEYFLKFIYDNSFNALVDEIYQEPSKKKIANAFINVLNGYLRI